MKYIPLLRGQLLNGIGRQNATPLRCSVPLKPVWKTGLLPPLCSVTNPESVDRVYTRTSKSRKNKKHTLKEDLIEFVLDISRLSSNPNVVTSIHTFYLMTSLLFVVLYVWSTYSVPARGTVRYNLDMALSFFFAVDYCCRIATSQDKFRAVFSALNLIDFLSFAPQIVEPILQSISISLARNLQWFRIFRTVKVLRLCVIAVNLSNIRHLTTSAVSSGALTVRIVQLFASIVVLLFTGASLIHLVERMPWHNALYFVTVTLTTVGYGDVVVTTAMGKVAVLTLMALGVVLIPVRATQVYEELTARRTIIGHLPRTTTSFVLVSKCLLDVRAFSDFYSEFFLDSLCHKYKDLKMVCLSKSPLSYEFRAFQDANENRLTCVEGTVLTDSDLILCHAHRAEAIFLLADRAAAKDEEEDLNILFQVWSIKSYTKINPLYVQVLRSATISRITPFLDSSQDIIISLESIRHHLLVLSCLCPGAPVLLGNLLRISHVSDLKSNLTALAGREWLRSYVNGCAYHLIEAIPGSSFFNQVFIEVVEYLKRSYQIILIGILRNSKLKLNPSRELIRAHDHLVLLAKTQAEADNAMHSTFVDLTRRDILRTNETDTIFLEESECIPLFEGEFESESIDADDLPCIPLDQLEHLSPSESHDLLNYAYPEEAYLRGRNQLQGHIVLCGSTDSFLPFLTELRRSSDIHVEIITPSLDFNDYFSIKRLANVEFQIGSPTDKQVLDAASVNSARAFLSVSQTERSTDSSMAVEQAVLIDSDALLTAYTVPPSIHSVVELCHTSSLRFLNPGILIRQGTQNSGLSLYDHFGIHGRRPRDSWLLRKNQLLALREEGMTEWQANAFFAAGRVLVPALMSTFASHSFLNKGLLVALLDEICHSSEFNGLMMDLLPVPEQFVGRSYFELFQYLTLRRCMIPLGLYRRKVENPAWRLHYVMTNPPGDELVLSTDRVYVIRDGCK